MKYYSLRIEVDEINRQQIDEILGVKSNYHIVGWGFEIVEKDDDESIDFIDYFLNILEDKYIELSSLDINRNDISIWLIYEYDNECNLEFIPQKLKQLGENGINLCISCYEKG